MPTHYSSVRIPLPEAQALADLYGVETDLQHALRTCEAAIQLAQDRSHDREVVESLVCAALIRYFRCFSKSPRRGLSHDEIGKRNKSIREGHSWFHWLRDRFVAHSINPLEQVWASAALAVRDGVPQPVTTLTHGGHRVVLGAAEAESIAILSRHALDVVRRKIKPEYRRVLKLVMSRPLSSIQEWASMPQPRVQAADVALSRTQTRPNPSVKGTSRKRAAPYVERSASS